MLLAQAALPDDAQAHLVGERLLHELLVEFVLPVVGEFAAIGILLRLRAAADGREHREAQGGQAALHLQGTAKCRHGDHPGAGGSGFMT
jgi:hypothetical protein